jgi:lysophospholipase L1-like esterase
MKNLKYRNILLFSVLGLLFACQPEIKDEFTYSSGSADFKTYVAVGNSLTAGYSNSALYHSSQANSYPSIIAEQMKKAGGGEFIQPVVESEYGVLPGKLELGYKADCLGNTSMGPVPAQGQPEGYGHVGYTVNNMGVPGAKSFHLLAPGYGNPAGVPLGLANPYFARFATADDATVIGDAVAKGPTFFSLWIGNNDVLGYASSGGIGDTITGQQSYAYFMNVILQSLTSNGAKGVIANIPGISGAAFFNTVPPNGYVLTQGQADTLNMFLGQYGFNYNAGPNYFIIADVTAPLGFRQMVEGELLLLTVPQDSLKCAYWGGFNPNIMAPVPIPDQYVLTLAEIANVNNAIEGYNATIAALAEQYGLGLVDINSYFKQVENGVVYDGVSFSTKYITGNAFSLDGVHLTQQGYALVANQFIYTINGKFGANLPTVSVTNYKANDLP